MLGIYPNCPLTRIFGTNNTIKNSYILEIKEIIKALFDKTSIESTFSLGNIIYYNFVLGNLVVDSNSSLAQFPKLSDYPHTELSKMIASSVRASSNVIINEPLVMFNSTWTNYFWNTGIIIEPCTI